MNAYKEISGAVFNAVECLVVNRLDNGAFTDQEDVHDRQYFSTLEGLDAILIPLVNLPKNLFWQPLVTKYPDLQNIITDDINFVIRYNTDQIQPPEEQGYPYFTRGGSIKKPYWTTECASFTLSVLANYLKLSEMYQLKNKISSVTIFSTIRANLEWMRLCRKDSKGWSWTFDTSEHPWPTWSLLDTFDELLKYRKYENEYRYLQEQCDVVVKYIIESFDKSDKGPFFNNWMEKVLRPTQEGKQYDVQTALDLTRLMLAAALHSKTGQTILPMAEILFEWASKCNFEQREYKYHLRERSNYIYDSSLIPSLFRTLIVTAYCLKPKLINELNEYLGASHELVLNRVYRKIQDDLIKDSSENKYSNLWGIRDGNNIVYELYYTERTIEALTEFLVYYKPTDAIDIKSVFEVPKAKEKKKSNIVIKKKHAESVHNVKKAEGKKTTSQSILPNDIARYTLWIPPLSQRSKPSDLNLYTDWTAEDMLEFYIYRLFTQVLLLDGTEWGRSTRFQDLPDGRVTLPHIGEHCLYDAKSSKGAYNLSKSELRKFVDYTKQGKIWAQPTGKEVRHFIIIAPLFAGDLKKKSEEFQSQTGVNLVCIKADDICNFTDKVRDISQNSSEIRLIPWASLFSKGHPLLDRKHFDKTFEDWNQELDKSKKF